MTGKDILVGLSYIDGKYVEDAAAIPAVPRVRTLRRPLLIAALTALMLLLVGCTIAYAKGWFVYFFQSNSESPLSRDQISYVEKNEQLIQEVQMTDDWKVELRSAISDGTTAYVIIGVSGPEGTNLEPRIEDGVLLDVFTPGNGGMAGGLDNRPDIVSCSEGVLWSSLGMQWLEDGDGKSNTKNYIIQIYPDMEKSTVDPFGPDAVYHIYLENIVREYRDEAYRQELLDTKYRGQEAVMFTHEETVRMHCVEILAEGIWEFDITFDGDLEARELLTQPVTTKAVVTRRGTPFSNGFSDSIHTEETVTLTSVVMRPLSVVFTFADCGGSVGLTYDTDFRMRPVYAVMKDGSKIALLPYGAHGALSQTLEAETPLVLQEVSHILLSDGTKLPVPTDETG